MDDGHVVRARTALQTTPPTGRRAFAFVLSGCDQDGAGLILGPDKLNAKLTGGKDIACDVATHYLATFTIDQERIACSAWIKV